MLKLLTPVLCLAVVGCVSHSGVMKLGPDTYTTQSQMPNVLGGEPAAKRAAFESAGKHCASMGKELLVSNFSSGTVRIPAGGSADVTFQCLEKDDPSLKRPRYESAPDAIIKVK